MELTIPWNLSLIISDKAKKEGISPEEMALRIISSHFSDRACLVPECRGKRMSRGLCQRHYLRVRNWIRADLIREDWLVARGKMLPSPGVPISSMEDTLETLPVATYLASRDEASRWFFGFPEAQRERDRLEQAAGGGARLRGARKEDRSATPSAACSTRIEGCVDDPEWT